jgi:hypothetical protein
MSNTKMEQNTFVPNYWIFVPLLYIAVASVYDLMDIIRLPRESKIFAAEKNGP